jgi:class 3 adenylate cyclase
VAGTLSTLKARRKEMVEPPVAAHQARIFKITGDRVLAEFSSTVDAVECAIDLQRRMGAAKSDLDALRREDLWSEMSSPKRGGENE